MTEAELPLRSSPTKKNNTEQMDEYVTKPQFKTQFLASTISCLAAVSVGICVGFTSPAEPDMKLPGRRFHLTTSEASLFSSLATIGALCGGLIAGFIVDFLGRKSALIYMSIPNVLGWLFIVYAGSPAMLYLGRVLTGICTGVACLNTPVYMSEIASSQIRGILGSGFQLFVNVGITFTYIVGAVIPWSYLAVVASIIPILLMALMIPMPETPVWLVRQGRLSEAAHELRWLRGPDADVHEELENLRAQQNSEGEMSLKEFLSPSLLKPLALMLMQMLIQQFSGINAVVFNAVEIFKMAGSSMDSKVEAIIVAAVMVIASIFAAIFMDKAGRRVLLLLSAACMTVSLVVLGIYFYVYEHDKETALGISWLPIICLIVYCFVFNIGFGPVPWIMMAELFPSQARGTASSLVTASTWTMAFIITKTFLDLQAALQSYGVFWFFGCVCFAAIPFTWFFVPETKGKSIEEIQMFFNKEI